MSVQIGMKRRYTNASLLAAHKAVKLGKISVYKAARSYSVPEQTLRDRVKGVVINSESVGSGRKALFCSNTESQLVEHAIFMAKIGHGITPMQMRVLGGTLAGDLKLGASEVLSKNWLRGLLKRWPELKLVKPEALTINRSKSTTPEVLDNYFAELQKIMVKYNLLDKPHKIYNVDETGFSTEHTPPKIITARNTSTRAHSITSPRTNLATLLACGNAVGNCLPPFFVFAGKKHNTDLLEGCLPGGALTMSDNGWSNRAIFLRFLQEHFLKYIDTHDPTLLLYDGHTSHITPDIINLALTHNIILFVLPAHTSHATQPLDLVVFGPMKQFFHQQCHQYLQKNPGRVVNRYSVCKLICNAMEKAMTGTNLRAAFKKAGIVPLNRDAVNVYVEYPPAEGECSTETLPAPCQCERSKFAHEYLKQQKPNMPVITDQKRRKLNQSGGIAVAEPSTNNHLHINYQTSTTQSEPASITRPTTTDNEQPSTSANKQPHSKTISQLSQDVFDSEEMCCVCKSASPPGLSAYLTYVGIIFVKWAECDVCNHWVHLKFCSNTSVVRKNTPFVCPCCEPEQ